MEKTVVTEEGLRESVTDAVWMLVPEGKMLSREKTTSCGGNQTSVEKLEMARLSCAVETADVRRPPLLEWAKPPLRSHALMVKTNASQAK